MSDVNINYKGASIATLDATGTKTLLTQGKYCEGNIEVAYTKPSVEPVLMPITIRPDAEHLQSYAYDKYIVADEGLEIPAYTTTQKVIKASWNLSPTISGINLTTYRYLIAVRCLTIPTYSVETKAKGRSEYQWCNFIYEYTHANANVFSTLVDPTKKITSVSNLVATNSLYRELYWTSSSAITLYATNSYGVFQVPTAPSVSGTVMTIKSPALDVRGHTTYFTSTFMNALTDIRYQFAIDVYRVPANSLNIVGWAEDQMLQHMVDCINTEDHKLT